MNPRKLEENTAVLQAVIEQVYKEHFKTMMILLSVKLQYQYYLMSHPQCQVLPIKYHRSFAYR